MKFFVITAMFVLSGLGAVHSESLDETVARYLAGEEISADDIAKLTNTFGHAFEGGGVKNNGSLYLNQVKHSIIDPGKQGNWSWHSYLLRDARCQQKTYKELKAIYIKNKTPLVAYALVCPAMYVDDMELLPELITKIGENNPLKAHFDKVYHSHWKPRLDPDF